MIFGALLVAGLSGLAAYAPQQANPPGPPAGLKFSLAERSAQAGKPGGSFKVPPVKRIPPELRMAPREPILIATPSAGEGLCSVPLVNALRGALPPSRMPVIAPPPHVFDSGQVRVPAPPCGEKRP